MAEDFFHSSSEIVSFSPISEISPPKVMIRQRLVLTALIGLISGVPDDPLFDVTNVEKIRFEAIEPLVAKSTENLIVDIYVSFL